MKRRNPPSASKRIVSLCRQGREGTHVAEVSLRVVHDHGRAVNVPDPSWPITLRGIAAQVFLRWKRELRPRGFKLNARVVDFPGGVPGHIGLFLVWGE